MSKKYYIALDDYERGTIINCLNEKRNNLIADGKFTDAVDEVLLKIMFDIFAYVSNDDATKVKKPDTGTP